MNCRHSLSLSPYLPPFIGGSSSLGNRSIDVSHKKLLLFMHCSGLNLRANIWDTHTRVDVAVVVVVVAGADDDDRREMNECGSSNWMTTTMTITNKPRVTAEVCSVISRAVA